MASCNKTTILVVGCGSIGERHLRSFLETGRAEVIGCETDSPKRATMISKYGVPVLDDYDLALKAPHLRGVVIATPANSHIPLAIKAARSGKHLLIEKPLALEETGIEELSMLAHANAVRCAVAYVYRFRKVFSMLKTLMEAEDCGKPLLAMMRGGQPFDEKRPGYENTYFANRETGGGVIQDSMCHYSDLMGWFLGRCKSLAVDAKHLKLEKVRVDDSASMLANYGETMALIHINLFQAPTECTLEIHFEKASLRADIHGSRVGLYKKGWKDWDWRDIPPEPPDAPFIAQAHAFLDMINGQRTDLATLQDGLDQVHLIQTAMDIVTHRPILQTLPYTELNE